MRRKDRELTEEGGVRRALARDGGRCAVCSAACENMTSTEIFAGGAKGDEPHGYRGAA